MSKIPGGYILQPRRLDKSEVMKEPPIVRELWLYLIRKVNWKDGKLPRGTGFFRFADIQDDLCWYVGFRKMKYSKPRLTKALRRLCEGNMTATVKATRGIIITILNYEHYQNPKNYEGNDEDHTKVIRRQKSGHTIIKEGEEVKEEEVEPSVELPKKRKIQPSEFHFFITDKIINHVTSQQNINVDSRKRTAWANAIRLLMERDLIGENGSKAKRVESALNYVLENYSDQYCPVVESGGAFRKKFIKIENQMSKKTQKFSGIKSWLSKTDQNSQG